MKYLLPLLLMSSLLQAQPPEKEKAVLEVVQRFFDALEKQDTASFRNMFLNGARNYAARAENDSVFVRSFLATEFHFKPGQILKERMRAAITEVKVHGNIAMVWAPYDLWVNETFSHCGVDVFTLIKTSSGWKIASVSYTVERDGCQ
jgi:hypothetical protein